MFEKIFNQQNLKATWINIDSSKEALDISKKWNDKTKFKTQHIKSSSLISAKSDEDLLIASFSLCEMELTKEIIDKLKSYKTLILLEPGQKKESKKLINLRNILTGTKKFFVHAPCTHQNTCPMTNDKSYWCHDSVIKPEFLNSLELPFSKSKLNLSYLIISKESSKKCRTFGRVVGDQRIEKGKTRLSVCFEEGLTQVSWLKKTKLNIKISRGELIKGIKNFDKKGHEIRISEPMQKVCEASLSTDNDSSYN